MRISDVAECLQVDVSTVSLQLRRLRRDQLVETSADERDRRTTVIALSARGIELLAQVREARRVLLAEALGDLPPSALEPVSDALLLLQDTMVAGAQKLSDSH